MALGYFKQYEVDVNRESNPGVGGMDFKLSVRSAAMIVIEMKLSSKCTTSRVRDNLCYRATFRQHNLPSLMYRRE